MDFTTNKLSATMGLEIIGVDLKQDLSPELIQKFKNFLYEYQVIVFRDQEFTQAEQIHACGKFGDIEPHPLSQNSTQHRELTVVSNVSEDGKALGYAGPQFELWHSDVCYYPKPTEMSMLYAELVPSQHGETFFADQYRAYNDLPNTIKQQILGKHALFGFGEKLMQRCQKRGFNLQIAEEDWVTPVAHPVVRTHPYTKKNSLYVNWTHTDSIVELSAEDSEKTLDFLYNHQVQEQYRYVHSYKPGDLVIWDNCSTLHTGSPFLTDEPRIMRRVMIQGTEPFLQMDTITEPELVD